MRNRASVAALLVLVTHGLLPMASARADDKDAVTEIARRRFQEGVKFFDQKRYEEARASFLQAYALRHHPAVLLNLGQSEVRSGHPLEGARHLAAYLRDSASTSAAERSEAERSLAAARAKLARIMITVNLAGSEIVVDGEVVGQSPLPEAVDVTPGNHSVEARMGGRTASANVTVGVGKSTSTTLTIEPLAAPSAAPLLPATTVSAPPVDTNSSESSKDGPSSSADISLTSEGRQPFFQWLTQSPVGLLGLGVTVAGLGVGTGFAIASSQAGNNADKVADRISEEGPIWFAKRNLVRTTDHYCDPLQPEYEHFERACALARDDLNKRDTDRTVATVGFVAAGVGVVSTVTLYFLTASKGTSAPRAAVTPVFAPHSSGLAVVGVF